jgi:glyoxylase-like metal-dependent hydrolase (beta-lactamase superfamily II)
VRPLVATVLLLLACTHAGPRVQGAARDPRPTYDVYAVRYATIPGFRVSNLIAGVDTARRIDLAMMVWLLRGSDGRNVLVDAGFRRDDLVRRWNPSEFLPPSEAVAGLGIKPEDVTDVIISHVHWDHLDGADAFPRARIWMQREEFGHHVDTAGHVLDRAIDAGDAKMLADLRRQGRVMLIDGDAREILPGVTVYTGGEHTFASQFAGVRTEGGTIVIASDNAYLYENLERRRPIAQALDSVSNLRAQDRMRQLASRPELIVPGHDPMVFTRFPSPGGRVARIR